MATKLGILCVFLIVTLAVGIICRKSTGSVEGFVLGGRGVGSWLTAFAYGTSYFSAVIFIGYAGQFGWKYGISATWIGLGNAIIGSLLAWVILGRRTRIMTQALDSSTMPDFFGKRFNSELLRIASSVIVFVFLIPYTASLYNGLSRLFGMAFGVDYIWCVLGMACLTAAYVVLGGYTATAVNDFIQGLIMIAGISAVIYVVIQNNGGADMAMISLSKIPVDSNPDLNGALISFFGPAPLELLGVVLLTSFGTWGLPQMIGKFYAIRDEMAIAKGTVISTLFAVVVAGGSYLLGGFGRLYSDTIERTPSGMPIYDSIVPSMLSTLPDLMLGLVVVLVLSASISTLSSLVITSASTFALDVVLRKKSKSRMNSHAQLFVIRGFVVFFIVVSSIIAIVQARSSVTFIAQLMGISWGALAGAFLGPYMYSLYWRRVTSASVLASFAIGSGIMIACMICHFAGVPFISKFFSSPINAGVLAKSSGVVIVPIISILTKMPDKNLVDSLFATYERRVTVTLSTALPDEG